MDDVDRHFRKYYAFTLMEAVLLLCIIGLAISMLLFYLADAKRRGYSPMSEFRITHQAMVIYSNSNNGYLPGLDASGAILPDGKATGFSGSGGMASARAWIILNGQFVEPRHLVNPYHDSRTKWKSGPVTTQNFSYAMLQIADTVQDAGRRAEWRDLANSQSILLSDRNAGLGNGDSEVQSIWTTTAGVWKGTIAWGDNHCEFVVDNHRLHTRYHGATSSHDKLFVDGPAPVGSPATEQGTKAGSNAMMIWN